MEVTEVRIRLVQGNNSEKLCAFATITLDNEFVVRDMKVIDGSSGLFIAMPSRKITERCRQCGCKNSIRASFCNECGGKIPEAKGDDDQGRSKLHVDVAHPVTSGCREMIHKAVVSAYLAASGKEKQQETPLDGDGSEKSLKSLNSRSSAPDGWQVFS
jgi:stage V sporulation protein G